MKIVTSFSAALDDFNDIDFESDLAMTSSSNESSPISPDTVLFDSPRFVGSNDNGDLWVLSQQGPVLKFPAKFWSRQRPRLLSTIFLTLSRICLA